MKVFSEKRLSSEIDQSEVTADNVSETDDDDLPLQALTLGNFLF